MKFEELAFKTGKAAARVGSQAERPAFSQVLAARQRRIMVSAWSTAAVVALGIFGIVFMWPGPEAPVPPAVAPTTTTTTLETEAYESLERQLEAAGSALGLNIPGGGWIDWGSVVCENPSDTNALMTTADDLVVWAQDGEPASAETTLLAAQILWENTQILCPEMLTEEELSAGPPTEYEFPRCTAATPVKLPWSTTVGEPTEEATSNGVIEASWLGPIYDTGPDGSKLRQELVVMVGRGEVLQHLLEVGQPSGAIQGTVAYVHESDTTDLSGVEVGWANSGRWCDAVVVTLTPDPRDISTVEVADPVEYVETLMFPELPAPNEAESIIIPAVQSMDGAEALGGEPSHGSPTASMGFRVGNHEYWILAVPTGIDSELVDHGDTAEPATVNGIDVSVFANEQSLTAVFDQAGLTIRVDTATAPRSALVDAVARLIHSIDQVAGQS